MFWAIFYLINFQAFSNKSNHSLEKKIKVLESLSSSMAQEVIKDRSDLAGLKQEIQKLKKDLFKNKSFIEKVKSSVGLTFGAAFDMSYKSYFYPRAKKGLTSYLPILGVVKGSLPVDLIISSSMKHIKIRSKLDLSQLILKSMVLDINIKMVDVAFFIGRDRLMPSSSDFMRLYSSESLHPDKGILVSSKFFENEYYQGGFKGFIGNKPTRVNTIKDTIYLTNLTNSFTLDGAEPYFNVSYFDKVPLDRKYKGNLMVSLGGRFQNTFFKNLSLALQYNLSTSSQDKGSLSEYVLKTFPILKVSSASSLYFHATLQTTFLPIEGSFGLFESGANLNDDFSNRPVAFRETKDIKIKKDCAGLFAKAELKGLGTKLGYLYSFSLDKETRQLISRMGVRYSLSVNEGEARFSTRIDYLKKDNYRFIEGEGSIVLPSNLTKFKIIKDIDKSFDEDDSFELEFLNEVTLNFKQHEVKAGAMVSASPPASRSVSFLVHYSNFDLPSSVFHSSDLLDVVAACTLPIVGSEKIFELFGSLSFHELGLEGFSLTPKLGVKYSIQDKSQWTIGAVLDLAYQPFNSACFNLSLGSMAPEKKSESHWQRFSDTFGEWGINFSISLKV